MVRPVRDVVRLAVAHLGIITPETVVRHISSGGLPEEGHLEPVEVIGHSARWLQAGMTNDVRRDLRSMGRLHVPSMGTYEVPEQLAFEEIEELVRLYVWRGKSYYDKARRMALKADKPIDVDAIIAAQEAAT